MGNTRVGFFGRSTAPDVTKLIESVGTPTRGSVVTYEQIEAILGMDRRSSRFRTVVSSWRRRVLRETGVNATCEMNVGFRFQDAASQAMVVGHGLRKGMRTIFRAAVVSDHVKPELLSDHDRSRRDQALTAAKQAVESLRSDNKRLAMLTGH